MLVLAAGRAPLGALLFRRAGRMVWAWENAPMRTHGRAYMMTDLSAYFDMSRAARNSYEAANARAQGAAFSLYAAYVDALHLPQFVEWLDRKLTRKAQR